ncbi:MAG: hemerythrin domain-containing protein [Actinobacteria bacterium]|nr:hemerythrin domain-containing protein [Actinomycetota bacterium]
MNDEVDDQMDVIDLLERDHRMINQLAAQLEAADDPAEIRSLFLQIGQELAAHEAVEQQVLFPAFRLALATTGDDTLDRRMGEHEEVNELLAEMRILAPDGFGFTKRASALMLEVNSHFQLEEDTVFARMRAAMSTAQLAELTTRAAAAKRHAPAFPDDHPHIAGDGGLAG